MQIREIHLIFYHCFQDLNVRVPELRSHSMDMEPLVLQTKGCMTPVVNDAGDAFKTHWIWMIKVLLQ